MGVHCVNLLISQYICLLCILLSYSLSVWFSSRGENLESAFVITSVMPSEDVDAHGTEGAARHRKNTNKQSNCDNSNTSAYTEEQYEAVQRYNV